MWCNICEISPGIQVPVIFMCLVQNYVVEFLWNFEQSYENIPLNSETTIFQNLIEDFKTAQFKSMWEPREHESECSRNITLSIILYSIVPLSQCLSLKAPPFPKFLDYQCIVTFKCLIKDVLAWLFWRRFNVTSFWMFWIVCMCAEQSLGVSAVRMSWPSNIT